MPSRANSFPLPLSVPVILTRRKCFLNKMIRLKVIESNHFTEDEWMNKLENNELIKPSIYIHGERISQDSSSSAKYLNDI